MYFTTLMVVHVLGAVAGIGPTFAFGLLGSKAGKSEPAGAIALLDATLDIVKKVVTPVVVFTQPLTGVLLIVETNRHKEFFTREWLWISILAYIGLLVVSFAFNQPAMRRVVKAMRAGTAGTPEFMKDLKTAKTLGPLSGMLTVLIVVLMVWKPGDLS